ncbi:hypothetical protein [Bacillus sp. EB600]|uniref:hypothetical protein n=1 Tax=Bacillus sp. EB600 TaxID=2806345 RepID=UPI00210DDF82|nr:hypothetical protein [Bacillus sp. EB600]MCQ6281052.1 hypothetical protein [Bacillus sp. EB600]
MDHYTEKAYTSKDVFTTLDIGDSTLRKWCLALEKSGYAFIRNDKNRRLFVEGDLVVLRHFQNLVNENMPLENAANLVVDRFGKGAFQVSTHSVLVENEEKSLELQRDSSRSNEELVTSLIEFIRTQDEVNRKLIEDNREQKEFNHELLQRLDQQQEFLEQRDERAEERDKERLERHDKRLIESIRESQETKKIYLEIQQQLQQIASSQEEKKKGFFVRFFGK